MFSAVLLNVQKCKAKKEEEEEKKRGLTMLLFIRISSTGAKPFPQEEKVSSQTAAFLEESCRS